MYLWSAATPQELLSYLRQTAPEQAVDLGEIRECYAWLPSGPGAALTEQAVFAYPMSLAFWRTWMRSPEEGPGFAYWRNAGLLVLRLVAGERFVPCLEKARGEFRAEWVPVYSATETLLLAELESAMPPVAYALRARANQRGCPSRKATLQAVIERKLSQWLRSGKERLVRQHAAGYIGRWQTALTATNPTLEGTAATLDRFREDVDLWRSSLRLEHEFGQQLAFSIEEPPAAKSPGPRWQLQASLRDQKSGQKVPLPLPPDEPELAALAERALMEASVAYPALRGARKGPLPIDSPSAMEFLRVAGERLEHLGFHVEWPEWWKAPESVAIRVRGNIESAAIEPGALLTLDQLVRVDWRLELDGAPISAKDLDSILKSRDTLVRINGRWVRIDPNAAQEASRFLKQNRRQHYTPLDVLRLALGHGEDGSSIAEVRTEGWLKELIERLANPQELKEQAPPTTLRGTLRPYQVRGYSWLRFLTRFGLGACLADDMGLGKSIQTLALLGSRLEEAAEQLAVQLAAQPTAQSAGKANAAPPPPVLLVCPTSVLGNWEREVQRFLPSLRVLIHHGQNRAKGSQFEALARQHDVVLISYPLVSRDLAQLEGIHWDGVILDEAQNVKNVGAQQSRAVRLLRSNYRIALTGTPVENHPRDLYSLMEFLNPGLLGSLKEFELRFGKPIHVYGDTKAMARLRHITAPFLLRRMKTDRTIIDDLPEKLEFKVYVKLTKEQARLYDAVVKQSLGELAGQEGMRRKAHILATITRLKQVCDHPELLLKQSEALEERSGKLERLKEMLLEIRQSGERALIFTQFAEMAKLLATHLETSLEQPVLLLTGETDRLARDRMVRQFEEEGGPGIFVLSLKAGGSGLNLTPANHVFHYDRWWNPAVENQATDRAFRIGQTRQVEVHKFLSMGTLEERIDLMIDRKRSIADQVVGAEETWLTEMGDDELRDLFSLSREGWEF